MWQLYVGYIYFVVILELVMDTAVCEIRLFVCVCVCVLILLLLSVFS